MLPTPEQIESYIKQGIACSHIQVEGDGQHFFATIVSPDFAGKRLVQRHQLVYAAMGDRMKAEVHALSIKAFTPEEFEQSHG
ncbi:BolA family protein [Polynucleobacter paneuropaeus]|jgi:acid stress-induced BolA-like protein IbaG/YrbA|uniref:BolA family transcriptional regulator n=1 Tax=Polynucleobacter paneuropaeus TaxID=2527775 RepID=A0A2Z4JRL9_9BURK|nr:BolA family protein [Polynucleobacter paneuropaeus]AWW43847.1 BolA family transcriptional regulator [Polynucleobacter paneuropaeus]AWW45432.1 BolA family transcriptional regulator [Polynucleobacter paneuropaeus]AWW47267.1 BolA family transcriptional regulator [Polynucleobacter paneuropaeus]AWW48992.1 BolA family transcriptional regulator [Polynucleobacter paneuropaeus]MBT8515300.1 BolA family transcriptional regulator [Polynucleobacter paneuropaeus]